MRTALLCLAFLMVLSIGYAQEEIENLLQNPNFEDGNIIWSMWVEDGAIKPNVIRETVEDDGSGLLVLEGDLSLMIDIQSKGKDNKRIELHQNPLDLNGGDAYIYAFFARAEPGREARMICNHRADPWTNHGSANITILEEWQEFTADVKPAANDANAGIYVELRDNVKGTVWFDVFRLYEGEYVEPDLPVGPSLAVQPQGKLAATWAGLKQSR